MAVDISTIKNFCDDRSVFADGVQYVEEERVFDFSTEGSMIKSKVRGAYSVYETKVVLGEDDIERAVCSCGAPGGVCKHTAAALLYYEKQNRKENDESYKLLCEKVSGDIVADISNIRLSRNKKTIALVPCIEMTKDNFGFYGVRLGFETGADKLYRVRKTDKFFEAIEKNESLEFSKNFVFNGRTQTFGDAELALVNYLQTVRQVYHEMGRTLSERYIPISGNVMSEVFRLASKCEKCEITVDRRDVSDYPIYIHGIELPLQVSKSGESYSLEFEKWMDITPVDKEYRVVMYQNGFYVLSTEQSKLAKTLVGAGNRLEKAIVTFKEEDKNAVVEQIMPKLRYLSELSIDDNIRKDILIAELKVKVFLETTEEKNIKAKVLFCYEDIEFNHFAGEKPGSKDRVLLRDKRKENEFIRMAAKMGFVSKNGYLYINIPSKIYNFLESDLKVLSEHCDIYYSDDFYRMKVVMPSKAIGSVNIGVGDLFEFQVGIDDIPESELESVLEAVREKQRFYRLTNGNFVSLQSQALEHLSEVVDNIDGHLDESGIITIPLSKALYLETQSGIETLELKREKPFIEILEKLKSPVKSDFEVPDMLKGIMRGYQVTGFKWLKTMASYGFGGILADEMGLGKTLQTIAFIISEYSEKKKPSLIIVPTSLLFNWQAEFEKFAPGCPVKVICGLPEERRSLLKGAEECMAVITSYGLIRRDIKSYKEREWSYCFIDEAQHIKNPNTVNAKAVKQIKADGYFAITGTPIENNLTELWSIFDFIMPGYLFSRAKYRRVYEVPIIKKNDRESVARLLEHTSPFILRRLKSGVMKELPEKIETYMVTDLEEEQRELYRAYAHRAKEEILRLTREKGFEKSRIEILAQITRLRQLCCHPGLFIENYEGGSGKLNTLLEIVESGIASGRRMLIFSQFTSMLDIIAEILRRMGITYFYLDGSVKSSKRIEMCNAFNEGQRDVFLISLKAGGTGLNLVGADTVIHFDPWWNPAVENQATDRAHRIGQTKVVQVIKLVTKGTIEEKIQNLKEKKQELISSVLQEGTGTISSMTLEEIQGLFE